MHACQAMAASAAASWCVAPARASPCGACLPLAVPWGMARPRSAQPRLHSGSPAAPAAPARPLACRAEAPSRAATVRPLRA